MHITQHTNACVDDPQVVKARIGALIDREYLERDPDNTNQYRYLA
jgi:cullin 1